MAGSVAFVMQFRYLFLMTIMANQGLSMYITQQNGIYNTQSNDFFEAVKGFDEKWSFRLRRNAIPNLQGEKEYMNQLLESFGGYYKDTKPKEQDMHLINHSADDLSTDEELNYGEDEELGVETNTEEEISKAKVSTKESLEAETKIDGHSEAEPNINSPVDLGEYGYDEEEEEEYGDYEYTEEEIADERLTPDNTEYSEAEHNINSLVDSGEYDNEEEKNKKVPNESDYISNEVERTAETPPWGSYVIEEKPDGKKEYVRIKLFPEKGRKYFSMLKE